MTMLNRTFYFYQIFEDYTTFKEFTDQLHLYTDDADELLNQYIYENLMLKFARYNIAYDNIQDFKDEFALAYRENFIQFKNWKNLIDNINNLSIDDLKILSETVTNSALNPNTAVAEPLKPFSYVTSQLYGRSISAPLVAYLTALNTMPTQRLYEFLNKFNYLFLQILTRHTPIYYN